MKTFVFITIFCISMLQSFGQDKPIEQDSLQEDYEVEHIANIGFGFGLDYGGIGARLSFVVVPHVSLFGALGFNLDGAGYNGGLSFQVMPSKRVSPVVVAMYGYNSVIYVKGREQYNETYNGFTIGGGVRIKTGRKHNFFNVELLVPLRPDEFKRDLDIVRADPSVTVFNEPWPVGFAFGYHITL